MLVKRCCIFTIKDLAPTQRSKRRKELHLHYLSYSVHHASLGESITTASYGPAAFGLALWILYTQPIVTFIRLDLFFCLSVPRRDDMFDRIDTPGVIERFYALSWNPYLIEGFNTSFSRLHINASTDPRDPNLY